MTREGEGAYNDERWKSREEFMRYLLERAGDEYYPENITTAVFKLHAELLKYPNLQMYRKAIEPSAGFLMNKIFDRLDQKIIELRQMLVRASLGDSELARILAIAHANIKP